MPQDVEVQKVVLLPRFTSLIGARTFYTAPINVREFASANVTVFAAVGIGTSPTFSVVVQQSPDLSIWTTLSTITPTQGSESTATVTFELEWVRLAVTLGGTDPGFVCWAVADFVTRAPRR